jgi:hypothetical protein
MTEPSVVDRYGDTASVLADVDALTATSDIFQADSPTALLERKNTDRLWKNALVGMTILGFALSGCYLAIGKSQKFDPPVNLEYSLNR